MPATWLLSLTLAMGFVLTVGAAPATVPDVSEADVQVGPPNPLIMAAFEFLESQSALINKHADAAIKANKISVSDLPMPTVAPTGSVSLSLSSRRLAPRDQLVAKTEWTLLVQPAADRQFVFDLHLAHFYESRYCGGASNAGVGLARFSGLNHETKTDMPLVLEGDYRAMAILSARSIKTGRVQILDVAERSYSVKEK